MHLHRMSMLAAGGVGYVLGAKAGRRRYEQIRHVVREAPHTAEQAREHVEHAREKVMAAAEKIRHTGSHAGPPLDEIEFPDAHRSDELVADEFVEARPGDLGPRP